MQKFTQKIYAFLFVLLLCFQMLNAKKAKELIDLDFESESEEIKTTPAQKLFQKSTPMNGAPKTEQKITEKFQQKTDNKTIQVTYLDDKKNEQDQKKLPRKVTLHNGITHTMITYHYLGARVPTKFTVSFNDQEYIVLNNKQLETNECSLVLQDDLVDITLYYQFDVGGLIYRKGRKKITYRIPEPIDMIIPEFSWHKPEKVVIQGATLLKVQDI